MRSLAVLSWRMSMKKFLCGLTCLLSAILLNCGGATSHPNPLTPAAQVAAAKSALAIGFAPGDSASGITHNLTLPIAGLYDATITWTSSDPAVITNNGQVVRPLTQNSTVTITATITVGLASATVTFPITVLAQMTDAQAVAAAKAAVTIGYSAGDGPGTVTQALSLPTSGIDGCTITWASSDPAIASDGTVTRPLAGDLPVTLTATITSNGASDTKPFIVTVKAQMTDAQAVAAAKAALAIVYAQGDSASGVTQNLTLPITGSSGCTISWASDDPAIISTSGAVQQPAVGDAQVTLTATVSSHNVSDTVAFTLIVSGQMSDAGAVAAAKAALNIIYAPGDSASSVTQNVTLPTGGSNGVTIAWGSDTPSVISTTGVVTPPQSDPAAVTLTATLTSHSTSDSSNFVLTVQPIMGDLAAVAADKAALTIGYAQGDSIAHVTRNIHLLTLGTNGTTITWASSNPAIISISGGVTVPTNNDALVTMTATITRGSASDTAPFTLTVKATLLTSWVNVDAISPGNGAIEVDPAIVVRVPFQVDLDPATVNNSSFQLVQTSNSQNVPIVVTYDAASKTVSLAPQSPLAQGTEFTTIVTTFLTDSDENQLPSPMAFNFTTLSYLDILAQWKLNGDGADSSGHGNTLDSITGTFDSAIVHEGSASLYLNGGLQDGNSNINLGTQLTVAVWVNVDNPIQSSINTILANADTGESTNGFKLGINRWGTSDECVVIEVGDGATGGKWLTAPGLIQPGSWYHLAFVIDQPNHSLRIYYNGAQAALSFASDEGFTQQQFHYSFNTNGQFTIGAFPGQSYRFKGHLDDMRVYKRILSDAEIAKIAEEN